MIMTSLTESPASTDFIGRDEIINQIKKTIEDGAPAVVVKGPGGSGKSALLRRTAVYLGKKKYSFILVDGETHPELILDKISRIARNKGIKDAEDIVETTSGDLRKRILWFVENFLEKEKVALVFEDFETNLNLDGKFKSDRLREFLVYLKDSLKEKEAFMFFTTETDIPGFESIPMPAFTETEFKKFLSRLGTLSRLNQKSKETLMFDMGSNPRALQLLEHIASLEFGEKRFQWDALKKKIPNLAERILYKENEEADFSSVLLEKLMENLSVSQQGLLKALSIFDRAVGKAALDALQLKIAGKDRKKLVELSLLFYSDKHDLYRVHRLTARFMLGKQGEEEKRQLHLRAARYFETLREGKTERDIENEIAIRRHYLEAEEWDQVADISLELDQYLVNSGYPQLAFDLLQEIETRDFSRENRVRIFKRLGMFHLLFGQFDKVIDRNKKLIPLLEEAGDREGIAHSRRQMGMALDQKRKYDDALAEYDRSRELFEELDEIPAAVFNYLEMGKIQQKRGKYDEAADRFRRALELAGKVNDPVGIAESLFQLGRISEDRGEFDDALDYYRQSQQVKEKIGNEKEIASGLHQIGNVLFLKGQYDEALGNYQRSLALNEKQGDLKSAGYSLGQLGMIYHRKGETEEALKLYRKSLELFEKVEDDRGIASGLHQVGRIYQEQGKSDEALDHYKRSLEIREKNTDMPGMALGYGQLGLLYLERGEYEESMRSSTKSFLLFSRMNAPGAELARKNMLKVRDKLPREKFEEILHEFNIQTEPPVEKTEDVKEDAQPM